MHVSVPGMYQNPAPYREQTFTYSTALALTGRSAACAPLMTTRPAAEPSIRLLTNFMLNLQVALSGKVPDLLGATHPRWSLCPRGPALKFHRAFGHTREREGLKRRSCKHGTTSGCPPPSRSQDS